MNSLFFNLIGQLNTERRFNVNRVFEGFVFETRELFSQIRETTYARNAPAAGTYRFVINSQVQRTAAIHLLSLSLSLCWFPLPPFNVAAIPLSL